MYKQFVRDFLNQTWKVQLVTFLGLMFFIWYVL
jgi:hypothetical protein